MGCSKMNYFEGTIIEESLENTDVLSKVKIISTKVEKVTESFKTPWVKQWTMHVVQVPENEAEKIAAEICKSIDREHASSWYADFKTNRYAYIIFRDKVFYVDRSCQEEYDKVKEYGLSLGIPEHQLDFHPTVKDWEKN